MEEKGTGGSLSREAREMLKEMRKKREMYPDLSKRDYRKMNEMQTQMCSALPVPEGTEITETEADGVPVEILDIPGAQEKYILYIHGGGFLIGSAANGRYMSARIAVQCGRNVVGVNYTLATEAPFPAGLEDCGKVYRWMLKSGTAPVDISFFGESAGGNLVLALALWCKREGLPLPGSICAFSPACDLTFSSESYHSRMEREYVLNANTDVEVQSTYCRGADLHDPLVSPVFGDCTGFPPTAIHVGSEEMFYDDALHMAEVLSRDGVQVQLREWTGLCHTFLLAQIPESEQAYKEIADFFQKEGEGAGIEKKQERKGGRL